MFGDNKNVVIIFRLFAFLFVLNLEFPLPFHSDFDFLYFFHTICFWYNVVAKFKQKISMQRANKTTAYTKRVMYISLVVRTCSMSFFSAKSVSCQISHTYAQFCIIHVFHINLLFIVSRKKGVLSHNLSNVLIVNFVFFSSLLLFNSPSWFRRTL